MPKTKLKKKSTEEQIQYAREKLLNVCTDVQDDVTVQNMLFALGTFLCDLAFDTSPNPKIATHIILHSISDRLWQCHIEPDIKIDDDEKIH